MSNGVKVEIVNTATPLLKHLAKGFPREFQRALKSTGWWLRGEIKEGIREEAPGGQPYEKYSSITTDRLLKSRSRRRPRSHRPMGRLYSAVRYKYHDDSNRVRIGWISRSSERLGTLHEAGSQTRITDRMRRFFWASGVPLSKNKKYLALPKRPTIGPEYRENSPKVARYINDRIWSYLRKAEGR